MLPHFKNANHRELYNVWYQSISDGEESLEKLNEKIDGILDIFFESLPKKTAKTGKMIAKYALQVIIKKQNYEFLSFILSALEVTVHNDNLSSKSKKNRFGYVISYFFSLIKVKKFPQCLHSFDGCPPEWLDGLIESKSGESPYSQIEVREKLEESPLGVDLKAQRLKLKGHLGSGAYIDVWAIEMTPEMRSELKIPLDASLTLQLQIDGVKEIARIVYEVTLEVLELLKGELIGTLDPQGFMPLIRELLDSLEEETNFELVEWKNKTVAERTKNTSVEIDNCFERKTGIQKIRVTFDSGIAYWTSSDIRITRQVHGAYISELSKKHHLESLVQVASASSVWMLIFSDLFSGDIFNPDMHIRNMKCSYKQGDQYLEIVIGLYDEQALCRPATKRQCELFAHMLLDGIGGAVHFGMHPDEAIAKAYYRLCRNVNKQNGKIFAMLKSVVISTDMQRILDQYFTSPYQGALLYIGMIKAIGLSGVVDDNMAEIVKNRFKCIQLLKRSKKKLTEEEEKLCQSERDRIEVHYPKKDQGSLGIVNYAQKILFGFVMGKLSEHLTGDWKPPFTLNR